MKNILFLIVFFLGIISFAKPVDDADNFFRIGAFEKASLIYYDWLDKNLNSREYLDVLLKIAETDPNITRVLSFLKKQLSLNGRKEIKEKICLQLAGLYESISDYENSKKFFINAYMQSGMINVGALYKSALMSFYAKDLKKARDYLEILFKKRIDLDIERKSHILYANVLYYSGMKSQAVNHLLLNIYKEGFEKSFLFNLYFFEDDVYKKEEYYTRLKNKYNRSVEFNVINSILSKNKETYSISFFPAMYGSTNLKDNS